MQRTDVSHCGPSACTDDVLYFAISSGPQLLTIPVDVFREDLATYPTLHVVLDAGAPTDLDTVEIRIDGAPAACTAVHELAAFLDSACAVPAGAQALTIASGPREIAFLVRLRLERPDCHHVSEVCGL